MNTDAIDLSEPRCQWSTSDVDYIAYHDHEWGMTILRKRENFRRAFANFDYEKIARFNSRSVERLLKDASIIRHRGKIESTINNARRALELRDAHGSLTSYFWSFEPKRRESKAMSRDLKRHGFSFVGPTTAYAFMQAMGLVNDHAPKCRARVRCEKARKARGKLA